MIIRIKFLFITVTGLFFGMSAQSQWITEKVPTTSNLNSINLFDETSGWIVGDNGTMLYKDKKSWILYPKVTDENLYKVVLIDRNEGWAVGARGTILHLKGSNWQKVTSPTSENLYSVSFRDAGYGIAVGAKGTVLLCENGIWRSTKKGIVVGNYYSVAVKKGLSLIGGGLEYGSIPVMKIAENTNHSLEEIFNPGYMIISSLAIIDRNNAWAVGMPGTIFQFDGSNWKKLPQSEKIPALTNLCFYDENTGIAVGYSGTILTYSFNKWQKESPVVKVTLKGSAITGNTFYAVGNKGTLVSLKRNKEAQSGLNNSKKSLPIMIDSYPNPSSDKLNVIIPDEDGFVADFISVANVYGQIVFRKEIDQVNPGEVFLLNTSELNNGLYFINIFSSNSKTASGKFIVKH